MFNTIARIHSEALAAAKQRMADRNYRLKAARIKRAEAEIKQYCQSENWLEEVRWAR